MLQRVGFIGLGVMGGGMAKNVAEAGFELTVHDASPAAVRALEEHGARAAALPREVAEASDVVVTVLPATPQVEVVYLGSGGIAEGLRPGSITIDYVHKDLAEGEHAAMATNTPLLMVGVAKPLYEIARARGLSGYYEPTVLKVLEELAGGVEVALEGYGSRAAPTGSTEPS